MPRTSRDNYFSHKDLGKAIRYLREIRRQLTREQVCDRAAGLSVAYLRKIENGERVTMAKGKLTELLTAINVENELFDIVLASRPWERPEQTLRVRENSIHTEQEYQLAAEQAFMDAVWSNPVEDPTAAARMHKDLLEIMDQYIKMTETERAALLNHARGA